ncbi:MAG: adaptor protein MecA [Lactovum sp.]
MDYSYINDKVLRISLTFADLDEYDIELVDFLSEQKKIEDFFYEIMEELDIVNLSDQWDDMINFQIIPNLNGLDIFVTDDISEISKLQKSPDKKEFEDLLKQMTKETKTKVDSFNSDKLRNKKEKKEEDIPDFISYSVKFQNLPDLFKLSKSLKLISLKSSELYEFKKEYYLVVLDNQKERGIQESLNLRSRMLEYGIHEEVNRDLLREHGKIIIENSALEFLREV